jgi:predicted ATPase
VPADSRVPGPGPFLLGVRQAGPLVRSARAPLLDPPAWMSPSELDLSAAVTFLIGENGSGKSTTLEAIAGAAGFGAEGGPLSAELDGLRARPAIARSSTDWIVELGPRRPRSGFFLRAESFFNIARSIDELELEGVYGGTRLHEQSHGESFVALAANRFGPEGLYLLDEPEAALSLTSSLAFIDVMHTACRRGAQFVIATHSPVLLAFPSARILEFDDGAFEEVAYDDASLVRLQRAFLDAPGRFLRHLQ